ncbi:MAG: HEPN domain-containing protein [Candidatus Omnitrophica bacterium]|nr:HEPN domain-containing protein [Candidatus Omnitrophota bacterium]
MNELAREWIGKAEDDYTVARREFISDPPIYDAVCFHAQQCVEKYMKAILQENDIECSKTHDLDLLLEKCKQFVAQLQEYKLGLVELSSFAVEIRYPGVEATKEEGQSCLAVMETARNLIRQYFSL